MSTYLPSDATGKRGNFISLILIITLFIHLILRKDNEPNYKRMDGEPMHLYQNINIL